MNHDDDGSWIDDAQQATNIPYKFQIVESKSNLYQKSMAMLLSSYLLKKCAGDPFESSKPKVCRLDFSTECPGKATSTHSLFSWSLSFQSGCRHPKESLGDSLGCLSHLRQRIWFSYKSDSSSHIASFNSGRGLVPTMISNVESCPPNQVGMIQRKWYPLYILTFDFWPQLREQFSQYLFWLGPHFQFATSSLGLLYDSIIKAAKQVRPCHVNTIPDFMPYLGKHMCD